MNRQDLFRFHLDHNEEVISADQIPQDKQIHALLPNGATQILHADYCHNLQPASGGQPPRFVVCVSVFMDSLKDL